MDFTNNFPSATSATAFESRNPPHRYRCIPSSFDVPGGGVVPSQGRGPDRKPLVIRAATGQVAELAVLLQTLTPGDAVAPPGGPAAGGGGSGGSSLLWRGLILPDWII